MKQKYLKNLSFFLVCVHLIGTLIPAFAFEQTNREQVLLQDDFYTTINEQWLSETTLQPSQSAVSGFSELASIVQQTLFSDFSEMQADDTDTPLRLFLDYFHMATDIDSRNAQGLAPIYPYIEQILALESIACFNNQLDTWLLGGLPLPFVLYTAADMAKASHYTLYAAAPNSILPDITYYGTEFGDMLLAVYGETANALLVALSIANPEQIVSQALAFDDRLRLHLKSAGELANYANFYHPVTFSDFADLGGTLDFAGLLESLIGNREEGIVLTNKEYFHTFSTLVTDENFHELRAWMLLQTIFSFAPYLDENFGHKAAEVQMAQSGQVEPVHAIDKAFYLAQHVFAPVVGDYFGKQYFGEDARQAVLEMTENLIVSFEERLKSHEWLSEQTVSGALEKLENLQVHIGYPDEIPPIYEQFILRPYAKGGNLLNNTLHFASLVLEDMFARFGQEVDKNMWNIPAHMVNASYSPLTNTITFPAAILQAPFFSLEQNISQNYGGIGTIIAHEITHAFDLNGAHFGPDGSFANWWCADDFAVYEEKAEQMFVLFDRIPHEGGLVDGRFTLSENIADAGGLMCALHALQLQTDYDLKAFFENYAKTWRLKAREEYHRLLLELDCHAPAKLRANIQLSNLDLFYETYEIDETDDMYLSPEERVTIW